MLLPLLFPPGPAPPKKTRETQRTSKNSFVPGTSRHPSIHPFAEAHGLLGLLHGLLSAALRALDELHGLVPELLGLVPMDVVGKGGGFGYLHLSWMDGG